MQVSEVHGYALGDGILLSFISQTVHFSTTNEWLLRTRQTPSLNVSTEHQELLLSLHDQLK